MRFLEFFTANIRNPHTRRAYARAADEFLVWCSSAGVSSIGAVQPVHVATLDRGRDARARGAERQTTAGSEPPPVQLAGQGQVMSLNPAASVRGAPAHSDVRANAGARS